MIDYRRVTDAILKQMDDEARENAKFTYFTKENIMGTIQSIPEASSYIKGLMLLLQEEIESGEVDKEVDAFSWAKVEILYGLQKNPAWANCIPLWEDAFDRLEGNPEPTYVSYQTISRRLLGGITGKKEQAALKTYQRMTKVSPRKYDPKEISPEKAGIYSAIDRVGKRDASRFIDGLLLAIQEEEESEGMYTDIPVFQLAILTITHALSDYRGEEDFSSLVLFWRQAFQSKMNEVLDKNERCKEADVFPEFVYEEFLE